MILVFGDISSALFAVPLGFFWCVFFLVWFGEKGTVKVIDFIFLKYLGPPKMFQDGTVFCTWCTRGDFWCPQQLQNCNVACLELC